MDVKNDLSFWVFIMDIMDIFIIFFTSENVGTHKISHGIFFLGLVEAMGDFQFKCICSA